MNSIEEQICTYLQHEGIGSVYERVVLSRWFRGLHARYGYASVLEYSCPITKGYDNVTFLDEGTDVTVAADNVDRIRETWRLELQPEFCELRAAPSADLVWNFAETQIDPGIIEAMKPLAKRHVLVLVPNILNLGTPFHLSYHLLTRTACGHAERGSVRLRTRFGLLRLLAERGVEIIESGYIDAPPIPDIAFSIRELRETMGWSRGGDTTEGPPSDPATVWRRVQQMTRFENSPLMPPFKWIFGHHIYALGRVE